MLKHRGEKMERLTNNTYRTLMAWAVEQLTEAQIPEPEADAWVLMEAAFFINKTDFYINPDWEVTEDQECCFRGMVEERKKRIPLQYITGRQSFMGLDFQVTEDVLIPRWDTEILVDTVLNQMHTRFGTDAKVSVLDMCTGSGCIAVTIAKQFASATVTGADVSKKALEVAKVNGNKHDVEISWVCSNLFEQVQGTYDVIVSNPPYIPSRDIQTLEPEVKDHEPMLALDGSESGYVFYEQITSQASAYLKDGGILAYEIGYNQAERVQALMEQAGFDEIQVIKDLAGLDRVVIGVYHIKS
jgi:release factor glutamine methyltransferase